MLVIDLTQPLNTATPVYADADGHLDPAFSAQPWSTIPDHGYSVHRLEMGTHTGTHLDAPAHFLAGGRTVDQISASKLAGPVIVVDARTWDQVTVAALRPYKKLVKRESILLFLLPESGIPLTSRAVDLLVDCQPKLILYSGEFLDVDEAYYHNREWLGADIPLVTDLDQSTASKVHDGDLVIVAPLLLEGMDGAPCRVFALRSV